MTAKTKIMIVEDEVIIASDIKRSLETLGYVVTGMAASAEEALNLARANTPDLVLMDIVIKGKMDGIETAKRLISLFHTPIVYLTAYADDELFEKAKVTEPAGYLIKPFDDRELYFTIEMAVYKHKAQEALKKQREKFIAVLIHDLKGPMIPILGYTKRLLDGKVPSEEKRQEILHIIHKATQEIVETIEATSRDMKDVFTLNSFHPQEVEFHKLVYNILINFTPEVEAGKICLRMNGKILKECGHIDKIVLIADQYQLKCLAENLIGNAVKYARKTVDIELSLYGQGVKLVVSDDGPGIPQKYCDKIFEEYFQVPGSKKGTGLGLYSVKKIVDNHSGTIRVHCPQCQGTSFEVFLPVNTKDIWKG